MARLGAARLAINFAGKDISNAADRFHERRTFWIGLDLLSQSDDLRIDRAVERLQAASASMIHQRFPAQDMPGMFRQRRQKIEFAGGERDVRSGRRDEPPAGDIEQPAVEPDDVVAALRIPKRRFGTPAFAGAGRF